MANVLLKNYFPMMELLVKTMRLYFTSHAMFLMVKEMMDLNHLESGTPVPSLCKSVAGPV